MQHKATRHKAKLKVLIKAYVNAMVAYSWMGGGDPEDWEEILSQLKVAKRDLMNFIKEMSITCQATTERKTKTQ